MEPGKYLATPYKKRMKDLKDEIKYIKRYECGAEDASAELSTLKQSTLFSRSPRLLLQSELVRINLRKNKNSRLLQDVDKICQGKEIAREIRAVPRAPDLTKYALTKFPGQLKRSTFCAICRGVFSEKGCRRATVVQHPNCVCRGRQVYGRECIAKALRTCNLCPACRGSLKDNVLAIKQVQKAFQQARQDLVAAHLEYQTVQQIRHHLLLQMIEDIDYATDKDIHDRRARDKASEIQKKIEASVAGQFNSWKYFKFFLDLLGYEEQMERAWSEWRANLRENGFAMFDEDGWAHSEIYSVCKEINELCGKTLVDNPKTDTSKAATVTIQEICKRTEMFQRYGGIGFAPNAIFRNLSDTNGHIINKDFYESLSDESLDPKGALNWTPDATTASGYSESFNYIHFKALRELDYQANSTTFKAEYQWTPINAINAGLTFGYAVDLLLLNPNLTPSVIDKLQTWSARIIETVARLRCRYGTRIDHDNCELHDNFRDVYYGVQMDLILRVQRKEFNNASREALAVHKLLWPELGGAEVGSAELMNVEVESAEHGDVEVESAELMELDGDAEGDVEDGREARTDGFSDSEWF